MSSLINLPDEQAKLRDLNKQKDDINTRILEFKQHYEEYRQETER